MQSNIDELILRVLRSQHPKHLHYNDVLKQMIALCAEEKIDEPNFISVERRLRLLAEHGKISSDKDGYFWERLKDTTSEKLDMFFK
jgi:hypothetical protein